MLKLIIIFLLYVSAFSLAYFSYRNLHSQNYYNVVLNNTHQNTAETFFTIISSNTFIWVLLLIGFYTAGILSILILFYNIYYIALIVMASLEVSDFATIFKLVFIHGIFEFFAFTIIVYLSIQYPFNPKKILVCIYSYRKYIIISYLLLLFSAIIETFIYNSVL